MIYVHNGQDFVSHMTQYGFVHTCTILIHSMGGFQEMKRKNAPYQDWDKLNQRRS